MPAAEVSALLKELDVDVKGVSAAPGERKARLREFVGLAERERERGGGDEDDKKGGKVDGKAGKKKEEGRPLPGKATGPPPGKVLPIGARD